MAGRRLPAVLAVVLATYVCNIVSADQELSVQGTPGTAAGTLLSGSWGGSTGDRALLQDAATGQTAAGDTMAVKCPQLSKELLQQHAKDGTVMLAVANSAQWDFAANWLKHVHRTGITYAVVAASDALSSQRLAAAGQACFEWIDEDIPKLGLNWGEEGWRRMTWSKVFVVAAVVDWGFNLVVSDVDVVWFKDPVPLFAKHPHADLMFSEDGTSTYNLSGDDGLELEGGPFYDFNTGVYLLRYNNNTAAWTHAWRQFFDKCQMHDQHCAYELMRQTSHQSYPQNPRLKRGWKDRLWVGILSPSVSMNAHTRYLQRLDKVQNVEPYVVHLTWTYNGIAGKRSRMRDMGLWFDPPEYYSNGSYVTVDLTLPEKPPKYNEWNENEDMVAFYLETIHAQLQQAYVGMALAVAAGRAFILPQFQCYCEKLWYGVVRCRVFDAQAMPFPVPCPQDYLFDPAHYDDDPTAHGTPIAIRESSFLENERTPAEVKDTDLVIQPSAALGCQDCTEEVEGPAGGKVVLVPPTLGDARLLPLLEKYKRHRVWRLSFADVGSTQRAYGGFADAAAAEAFDRRMEHITTDFCCRREEEAPRYHKADEIVVKLSMTPEFQYSGSTSQA